MSSNVQIATITESIAGIDLPTIDIRDVNSIPESVVHYAPVLSPRPDDFITDLTFTRESFGAGEMMNIEYRMHWQYFHAPVGSGLALFAVYGDMVSNLAKIIEKIADTVKIEGAIDVKIDNINRIAVLKDASNNDFHGVELSLLVTEFINL